MSWQLKAGSCGSYSGIFPNVCVSLWEEVLGGVKGIDAIAPLASVDPRGSWSEDGRPVLHLVWWLSTILPSLLCPSPQWK